MSIDKVFKEWESNILEQNIYNIIFSDIFNNLSFDNKKNLYETLILNSEDILTTRINTLHKNTQWYLEGIGWKTIECYIELKHNLDSVPNKSKNIDVDILDFSSQDLNELLAIANNSFAYDRFHIDPNINNTLASKTRVEWVRNACNGRAKKILVAKIQDDVAGFLLIMEKKYNDVSYTTLDLMAVCQKYRKKQIGFSLVNSFLQYSKQNKYTYAMVGTQAHNMPSLRLYNKCGFIIENTLYSMHRFNKKRSKNGE